jgi:hypothetical protein
MLLLDVVEEVAVEVAVAGGAGVDERIGVAGAGAAGVRVAVCSGNDLPIDVCGIRRIMSGFRGLGVGGACSLSSEAESSKKSSTLKSILRCISPTVNFLNRSGKQLLPLASW